MSRSYTYSPPKRHVTCSGTALAFKVHKSLVLGYILSKLNGFDIIRNNSAKLHFNVAFSSEP
jgi:hypothetical protein